MSLHTYYVFVTIVSLKQRIKSNKSKKYCSECYNGKCENRPVEVAKWRDSAISFKTKHAT